MLLFLLHKFIIKNPENAAFYGKLRVTGSIGYWGLGGAVNTNIAIRTCYLDGDTLHYHTGAGITADSDPTSEWEETLAKAKVFLGV